MKSFALSLSLGLFGVACESKDSLPDPPAPEPLTMPAMEAADVETLHGVVGEVLVAGHYTYVRVEGQWAVVLGDVSAEPGTEITLTVQGSQDDFRSRRLERSFERLYFAST